MITIIKHFPKNAERVETGPIKFNDTESGIFIRGDNYGYMLMTFDIIQHGIDSSMKLTINNVIEKLKNEDYNIRIYDGAENITCDVVDGITYITGTTESIETGGLQFGDDWDGFFVDKNTSLEILKDLNEISKIENLYGGMYLNYSIDIFEYVNQL